MYTHFFSWFIYVLIYFYEYEYLKFKQLLLSPAQLNQLKLGSGFPWLEEAVCICSHSLFWWPTPHNLQIYNFFSRNYRNCDNSMPNESRID